MRQTGNAHEVLRTSAGDVPLHEYRLRAGGREWTVLHAGAVLTQAEENEYLLDLFSSMPYGIALWPASIALAHDVATRAGALPGARALELGAGTGLPGVVAASLGARVVQTDRNELAMAVCRRNGERNGLRTIEYRLVDWTEWDDAGRYEWILGSDVLYGTAVHPHLRRIFENNLAPGGRILLSDPFRGESLRLLEAMEADGWTVSLSKWTVGEEASPRAVAVYELSV